MSTESRVSVTRGKNKNFDHENDIIVIAGSELFLVYFNTKRIKFL